MVCEVVSARHDDEMMQILMQINGCESVNVTMQLRSHR